MLRLLTHKLSETVLRPKNLFLRQVPHVTVSSHGASLSLMCQRDSSRNLLLKSSAPWSVTNQCLFHTSSPKHDLQHEFQKHFKYMLSQVDWRDAKSSPQPALILGAAGLIPFVLPPVSIILNGAFLSNIAAAQLAYGAVILSFLGGVKWGFVVPEGSNQKLSWNNLGLSVSFALMGWGSLIVPPWVGNLLLLGGLGASTYVDVTSPGYPRWFKALRLCLSSVAMGSLGVTFILRILF